MLWYFFCYTSLGKNVGNNSPKDEKFVPRPASSRPRRRWLHCTASHLTVMSYDGGNPGGSEQVEDDDARREQRRDHQPQLQQGPQRRRWSGPDQQLWHQPGGLGESQQRRRRWLLESRSHAADPASTGRVVQNYILFLWSSTSQKWRKNVIL